LICSSSDDEESSELDSCFLAALIFACTFVLAIFEKEI